MRRIRIHASRERKHMHKKQKLMMNLIKKKIIIKPIVNGVSLCSHLPNCFYFVAKNERDSTEEQYCINTF